PHVRDRSPSRPVCYETPSLDLPPNAGGSLGTEGDKLQVASLLGLRSAAPGPPQYSENRVFGLIRSGCWCRREHYFKHLGVKFATRRNNGISRAWKNGSVARSAAVAGSRHGDQNRHSARRIAA